MSPLELVALALGCAAMSAGGIAVVGLMLWASSAMLWRHTRTWLLLADFYEWKRSRQPTPPAQNRPDLARDEP